MSIDRKRSPSTGLAYLSNNTTNVPERLILCIPGLGCPGSDYLPLLQLLAKDDPRALYIAIDLPGQGDSPASLCPKPTFSSFVALLRRVCDDFGNPSGGIVLIGHSMGCRLALEVFSQLPDATSAVILLDGSWHGRDTPIANIGNLPPKDVQLRYILAGLKTMFGPCTPDDFRDEHQRVFQEADLDYVTQLGLENRRWDAERMVNVLCQLRTVNESYHPVRLLLVQAMDGAGGPRRPLTKGEESSWMKLARETAGSAYSHLVIEDSGHWPHVDKTDEVARAISRLIRD